MTAFNIFLLLSVTQWLQHVGNTPSRSDSFLNWKILQLFVAVLGASNYTFAEATWSQQLPDWIGSHVRCFEFMGGVTEIIVPDNLKSGVKHPSYYDPELNPTYRACANLVSRHEVPMSIRL